MITKELLAAIKARCAAATPGEWATFKDKYDNYKLSVPAKGYQLRYPLIEINEKYKYEGLEADLDFIAHAKQDIPVLIEALEALMQEVQP